jgi:hypothetical protein
MIALLLLGARSFAPHHSPQHLQCNPRRHLLRSTSTFLLSGSPASSGPASACWVNEQSRELLLRFADALEPAEEKQFALSGLLLSASKDRLLDAALVEVNAAAKSPLASRRLPLRLPSKRAALGCYGRLLDEMKTGRLSIPLPTTYEMVCEPNAERRGRLFAILNQLVETRGVYKLEGDVLAASGLKSIGSGYGDSDV